MKNLVSTPQGRRSFYNFCIEYLGEDIIETIDTRKKEYPELTRVALLVKQELMENYPASYALMKKEMKNND